MKTLQNLAINDFLHNYWQQAHYLIRQALPGYQPPLTGDELAGLSLEEDAESRLIIEQPPGQWRLLHGPFDQQQFAELPESHWTLLVQAVDHWLLAVNELKTCFRFIPDWRLDDIMISYAAKGGSVGPHYDRYDVFLLQASGQRRWKIGQHCDSSTALTDNKQLSLLQEFDERCNYLLEPGDMLYLPPGCAHWGIAESDDCMTISIGFRAPAYGDIIRRLCDEAADSISEDLRFREAPSGDTIEHPSRITEKTIELIKEKLMSCLLAEETIAASFGQLITEPKYPENFMPDTATADSTQILMKRPDARLAYYNNGEKLFLFVNGHTLVCNTEHEMFIRHLAESEQADSKKCTAGQQQLLAQLFTLGLYEQPE